MSCDCNYYEQPEFYQSIDISKAKKSHKCCECSREIVPGSEYRRITGKWDGDFNTYKMCGRCSGIWDALTEMGHCLGHGALENDYNEYLYDHGRHKEQGGKSAREIMRGGNWTPFIATQNQD